MSFSVNDCRANGGGTLGTAAWATSARPGTSDLRNGTLFDRPQRTAGVALQHEQESMLARLRHDVDIAAVVPDRQQLRRGRQVVVPQVVMHGLEVPDPLAGLRVERDHAVGIEVRAMTVAAVEVVARRPGRDEDDAACLVDGELGSSCARRCRWPAPPPARSQRPLRRAPAQCGTPRPACPIRTS